MNKEEFRKKLLEAPDTASVLGLFRDEEAAYADA